MKQADEEGYALVAAVASIAVFAAIALAVLSATRMGIEEVGAEQAQLQAGAAVDAGFAIALSNLLVQDNLRRWPADGRLRRVRYGDAALRIRVVDERGKVPVGVVNEVQATRMLEQVGLSGDRLLVARDSLLDWLDDNEETRPFGAEADYYRSAGIVPPGVVLASVEELGLIRGFDAATVARLKPFVTTFTVLTGFDGRYADPRALAVMSEDGSAGPAAIDRARELAGQQTAISFSNTQDLRNRPLSIEIDADLPGGVHASRRAVVEITGSHVRPYFVRAYE